MLDLSGNQLCSIPSSVGKLSDLRVLDLSKNSLTSVPPELGSLTRLTKLSLSDNYLDALPETFGKLSSLTALYLSENCFQEVPECISALELRYLDLSKNWISEIYGLSQVKELLLGDNPLRFIDVNNGALQNLTVLDLSRMPEDHPITAPYDKRRVRNQCAFEFPETLCFLPSLTVLDLSSLGLTEIPFSIRNLTKLKKLILSKNKLTRLTPAIAHLAELRGLDLSGNRLTELPQSFQNRRSGPVATIIWDERDLARLMPTAYEFSETGRTHL